MAAVDVASYTMRIKVVMKINDYATHRTLIFHGAFGY